MIRWHNNQVFVFTNNIFVELYATEQIISELISQRNKIKLFVMVEINLKPCVFLLDISN